MNHAFQVCFHRSSFDLPWIVILSSNPREHHCLQGPTHQPASNFPGPQGDQPVRDFQCKRQQSSGQTDMGHSVLKETTWTAVSPSRRSTGSGLQNRLSWDSHLNALAFGQLATSCSQARIMTQCGVSLLSPSLLPFNTSSSPPWSLLFLSLCPSSLGHRMSHFSLLFPLSCLIGSSF